MSQFNITEEPLDFAALEIADRAGRILSVVDFVDDAPPAQRSRPGNSNLVPPTENDLPHLPDCPVTVFNVAQIDGLPTKEPVILTEVERIQGVEAFVKATDAEIKTGGNQPMYVPSLDYIVMPPAGAFRTVEHFYATELHELGHYAERRIMPHGRD